MLKERSRSRSLGREKERRYYSSDDEAHVTRSRHQLRGEGSQRRYALPAKSPEGDRNTRGRDRHSKDIPKRHRDSSVSMCKPVSSVRILTHPCQADV